MANQIISLPELKSWMNVSDSAHDAEMERAIEAATQQIEAHTGRVFALDSADQTRYYYPNEDHSIDLTDLVSVTSIAIDTTGDRTYATTLLTTDYELLPANGPRYDRIVMWPTSTRAFQVYPARRVRVVGTFGYVENGAAPPAVKQACLFLATRLFERRNGPFGILSATDLGQFERLSAKDPDVENLLRPYVASSPSAGFVVV